MAHRAGPHAYEHLTHRLNRFPQGAPPSDLLLRILRILFSEREAELVSLLPIKPFTARRAATLWKMDEPSARGVLEGLADRVLLVDIAAGEEVHYVLPPPMAGFFEFSLMRVRADIDQKLLSELFYQYLNVEEDFVRELFASGETQLGRAFVNEAALVRAQEVCGDQSIHVLDTERASEVVRTATAMGVSDCYCRVKMGHVGRACEAPTSICMTFNTSADALIRHGHARRVDVAEGLDLLQQAYDQGLVQFGENVRERVNFICNCCGCCCEAMLAARRFAVMHSIHTTNFLPEIGAACTGCGKCVTACPVEAMLLTSANDPHQPGRKLARLDGEKCLGCGVCVRACPADALVLVARQQRVITPLNSAHRVVLMAIERGKLQDLIFDNRLLLSHRALAALLGVILRLPPVQRLLATRQVRSRYLEALARRYV